MVLLTYIVISRLCKSVGSWNARTEVTEHNGGSLLQPQIFRLRLLARPRIDAAVTRGKVTSNMDNSRHCPAAGKRRNIKIHTAPGGIGAMKATNTIALRVLYSFISITIGVAAPGNQNESTRHGHANHTNN